MKYFLLLPMLAMMGGCPPNQRIVYKSRYMVPDIQPSLRTPCPAPEREVTTTNQALMVIVDLEERADCNASKIISTDVALTAFEDRIAALKDGEE